MTDTGRAEPEPIEIDFEPAEAAPPRPPRRARPPSRRSRTVTWPQLIVASGVAAALGATVSIIVNNANSSAPTGTLAREIDAVAQDLAALDARAQKAAIDIVSMRSRVDAHADRLKQKDAAETALRIDLTALSSQLSAVTGAGDGAAPAGASPSSTPLGILLARINRLERVVTDATAAPETTREVQRAVADLALQVAELDLANTTLVTAFDQREAALVALESGMQELALQVGGAAPPAAEPRISLATLEPPPGVQAAATRAQTIRSLSVLDAAVREGEPFTEQHRALSDLLPSEPTLVQIASVAERGAPTLSRLRDDFDRSAARAMRHIEEDSDDGWNWLRQAFVGVVTFDANRRVAHAADTLRSARRQLDIGEIREAVTAVEGLTGRAQADFAPWREKALERAQLDEAMRTLNSRLLGAAAVAQGSG